MNSQLNRGVGALLNRNQNGQPPIVQQFQQAMQFQMNLQQQMQSNNKNMNNFRNLPIQQNQRNPIQQKQANTNQRNQFQQPVQGLQNQKNQVQQQQGVGAKPISNRLGPRLSQDQLKGENDGSVAKQLAIQQNVETNKTNLQKSGQNINQEALKKQNLISSSVKDGKDSKNALNESKNAETVNNQIKQEKTPIQAPIQAPIQQKPEPQQQNQQKTNLSSGAYQKNINPQPTSVKPPQENKVNKNIPNLMENGLLKPPQFENPQQNRGNFDRNQQNVGHQQGYNREPENRNRDANENRGGRAGTGRENMNRGNENRQNQSRFEQQQPGQGMWKTENVKENNQSDDRHNNRVQNQRNRNDRNQPQNRGRGRQDESPSNKDAGNDYWGGNSRRGGGRYGDNRGRFYLNERIQEEFEEPPIDLEPIDIKEQEFNAFGKLFVGNLPRAMTQTELRELFKQHGDVGSIYLNNDSGFAFVHMDYRANACKAILETDGKNIGGRSLKVRFATVSEGISVKNLSPNISNELLFKAFSVFGTVESCKVYCDDRSKSKGEGQVIFKDKKSAMSATKTCQEDCYYITGVLRPVIVTALDASEESTEGLMEKAMVKNNEYYQERNGMPHLAERNSFEHDFGMQWKQLFSIFEEKKQALETDFKVELERFEKKMVLARVEIEAEKLRKELADREAESAELRRAFDFGNRETTALGHSGQGHSSNFDSFGSGQTKRPLEQSYESGFSADYVRQFNEYERSRRGFPPQENMEDFEQGGFGAGNFANPEFHGSAPSHSQHPASHAQHPSPHAQFANNPAAANTATATEVFGYESIPEEQKSLVPGQLPFGANQAGISFVANELFSAAQQKRPRY